MTKFILLLNTVKYLKPTQVYHRLYYFARGRVRKFRGFHYPLRLDSGSVPLTMQPSVSSVTSVEKKTFDFLNFTYTFKNGINWNFSEFGKLWTYNLTYFDFLQQKEMAKEEGLSLIYAFIDQSATLKDGLEPFPISLRGINWVKFLTQHKIKEQKIDDSLYAQYNILMDNLEYHLLGNHLLENGFSLLFGAYYFQDEKLYAKAKEILTAELEEQILEDGAHFELSPMYHQIMLFRVLDCFNLVKNNRFKEDTLLELLDKILGYRDGFLDETVKEQLKVTLQEQKPDIVFVAQGTPRQEYLMDELIKVHPALYMGLGGSFDIYGGDKKRAPDFFLKYHLEWLYRLLKEPTRFGRQLVLVKFLILLKLGRL